MPLCSVLMICNRCRWSTVANTASCWQFTVTRCQQWVGVATVV